MGDRCGIAAPRVCSSAQEPKEGRLKRVLNYSISLLRRGGYALFEILLLVGCVFGVFHMIKRVFHVSNEILPLEILFLVAVVFYIMPYRLQLEVSKHLEISKRFKILLTVALVFLMIIYPFI